eukprot:2881406-Rhodomonas_salina.1
MVWIPPLPSPLLHRYHIIPSRTATSTCTSKLTLTLLFSLSAHSLLHSPFRSSLTTLHPPILALLSAPLPLHADSPLSGHPPGTLKRHRNGRWTTHPSSPTSSGSSRSRSVTSAALCDLSLHALTQCFNLTHRVCGCHANVRGSVMPALISTYGSTKRCASTDLKHRASTDLGVWLFQAPLFDTRMLVISKEPYASFLTILYQRLT